MNYVFILIRVEKYPYWDINGIFTDLDDALGQLRDNFDSIGRFPMNVNVIGEDEFEVWWLTDEGGIQSGWHKSSGSDELDLEVE